MSPGKITALQQVHMRLGATMALSEGWMQPVRYSDGPEKEAEAALRGAGISDISPFSKTDAKGLALDEYLRSAFTRERAPSRPGEVKMIGGRAESFPTGRGSSSSSSPSPLVGYVCRLSDDHALVVSQPDERSTSVLDPEAGFPAPVPKVYLTNVTSTLAGINIVGPASTGILGKLTRVDLSPRRGLASPGCVETGLANVYALIVRSDAGDGSKGLTPSFDLYFGRDYAEYMWGALMDAGREFGIKPFGVEAYRIVHGDGVVK